MTDHRIRLAAFAFLEEQTALHDAVVPWTVLRQGFDFRGRRVPLVSPQGIFKPALLDVPLTFRTTAPEPGEPAPYHDEPGPDGLLHYRYRGTDPNHRDNLGMKRAARREVPLIYLFGIVPGEYLPIWPVYNPSGRGAGVRRGAIFATPRRERASPRSLGRTRHPAPAATVMMG